MTRPATRPRCGAPGGCRPGVARRRFPAGVEPLGWCQGERRSRAHRCQLHLGEEYLPTGGGAFGVDAVAAQDRDHLVVPGGTSRAGEADPVESGEGVEAYPVRAGEFGGLIGREQHAQLLLDDPDRVQIGAQRPFPDQADVELPCAQGRHLLRGGTGAGAPPGCRDMHRRVQSGAGSESRRAVRGGCRAVALRRRTRRGVPRWRRPGRSARVPRGTRRAGWCRPRWAGRRWSCGRAARLRTPAPARAPSARAGAGSYAAGGQPRTTRPPRRPPRRHACPAVPFPHRTTATGSGTTGTP